VRSLSIYGEERVIGRLAAFGERNVSGHANTGPGSEPNPLQGPRSLRGPCALGINVLVRTIRDGRDPIEEIDGK
jgi:hypothetical protein